MKKKNKVEKYEPDLPLMAKPLEPARAKGRILQIFLDSDFRMAHDGLTEVAKKNGVDVAKLEPGNYVVFVNHALNRVKLFAAGDTIAYKRLRTGQKLDVRVLQYIPEVFNGRHLDLDKGLEKLLGKYIPNTVELVKKAG